MDKATLLQTLQHERAAWDDLLARVDDAHMLQSGVSGEMSVKDIIAHVTWYERETVGILRQRAVIGSELWYRALDERNAAILSMNRERALADVRAEAQQVFAQLLAGVQALSEEDLTDPEQFQFMPPEWIPWKVIASNTYEHYPQHIPDIEAWLAKHQA